MDNKTKQLQALLYSHGGEMQKKTLSTALKISEDELEMVIKMLIQETNGQGLIIIHTETTASMRTAPECQDCVRDSQKVHTKNDIGTAGLEVLSIILYNDSASRSEIDYIRGVNSSNTIRHLVIRGLLEKKTQKESPHQVRYSITPELLAHLGITEVGALPDYNAKKDEIQRQLDKNNLHAHT